MSKRIAIAAATAGTALAAVSSRQQGKTAAMEQQVLVDGVPPRLSICRESPYYSPCGSYIGIRFKGKDVTGRVVEYNAVDGWVRLIDPDLMGKPLNRQQVQEAPTLFGTVEPYWRITPSRQVRRQLARIS